MIKFKKNHQKLFSETNLLELKFCVAKLYCNLHYIPLDWSLGNPFSSHVQQIWLFHQLTTSIFDRMFLKWLDALTTHLHLNLQALFQRILSNNPQPRRKHYERCFKTFQYCSEEHCSFKLQAELIFHNSSMKKIKIDYLISNDTAQYRISYFCWEKNKEKQ